MDILKKTFLITIFLLSLSVFSQEGRVGMQKVQESKHMISLEQVKIGQKSIINMVDAAMGMLPAELTENKDVFSGFQSCLGGTWKEYISHLTKYAQKNVDIAPRPDSSMKFLKDAMQKRDDGLKACFGKLAGGDEMWGVYLKKFVLHAHPVTLKIRDNVEKERIKKERIKDNMQKRQSENKPKPVREKKKWWQRN